MKKSCVLVLCAVLIGVLAGSLSAGCGGPAAPTTTLAAGDTGVDYPNYVYKLYGSLGKGELDVEAWKASEAGQKSVAEQRNFFLFKNEMDPAVLAYWEGLGMKKEIHDADDPALKWASYTPLAAFESGTATKYPVVFDFVGAERVVFSAEGHGIAHLGAKEGYIAICPSNPVAMRAFQADAMGANKDMTPGAQVVRILDALEQQGYPIDRTRVYVTGMSAGGVATAMTGLELPDVVAAVAMHSSLSVLSTTEDETSTIPFFTPPSDYTKAMEFSVPMLAVAGDHDFAMLPIKTAGVIEGLNLWLQVNDCPTQLTLEDSLAAQASSTDEAVKAIGVVGDKMWTRTILGVVHHGAEFNRADGTKMVEIVCVTNMAHTTSATFAELAWDFMSRFSRNPDGTLVVAK